jgi:hypothetical protein
MTRRWAAWKGGAVPARCPPNGRLGIFALRRAASYVRCRVDLRRAGGLLGQEGGDEEGKLCNQPVARWITPGPGLPLAGLFGAEDQGPWAGRHPEQELETQQDYEFHICPGRDTVFYSTAELQNRRWTAETKPLLSSRSIFVLNNVSKG